MNKYNCTILCISVSMPSNESKNGTSRLSEFDIFSFQLKMARKNLTNCMPHAMPYDDDVAVVHTHVRVGQKLCVNKKF